MFTFFIYELIYSKMAGNTKRKRGFVPKCNRFSAQFSVFNMASMYMPSYRHEI